MAEVTLSDLGHRYRSTEDAFEISNLNITWKDGSANALLGPSGCGKTTLLNVVSGLLVPSSGQVLFDGEDVTRLSPRDRHIAQVFQFPVVYEAMNVFDNLAFPLRNRKVSDSKIRERVAHVAELLGLETVLRARSSRLTLAEKQKVSLGRGIVREDTAAVLLDEPLTVIDPHHKRDLRRRLREVQRALGITMIYVTHDQHEALTFADQVTIMKDGRILQTADPETLHDNPEDPFVGYFIGSPGMNLLSGRADATHAQFGGLSIPIRSDIHGAVRLGIRPEFVDVSSARDASRIEGRVTFVEDTGAYKILDVAIGETTLKARVEEAAPFAAGDTVFVALPPEHLKVFAA